MSRLCWITMFTVSAVLLNPCSSWADEDKSGKKKEASAAVDKADGQKKGSTEAAARDDKSKRRAAARSAPSGEMREMFGQMREKWQQLQKAREEGDDEKVEQLNKEMRELREKISKKMPGAPMGWMLRRPAAGGPSGRSGAADPKVVKQRHDLMQKMMEKYRELRTLKEEGKEAEVEKVQQELQEMRKKFAQWAKESGPQAYQKGRQQGRPQALIGRPSPLAAARIGIAAGPQTPMQRMQHLHMAAANLQAAGFPEYAAKVRAEAEKLATAMKERAQADRAGGGDQELRQHVRRLTEEVRRLREKVEELSKSKSE